MSYYTAEINKTERVSSRRKFLSIIFFKKKYFYLFIILKVQYNINYYFFNYIISINIYNLLITLILIYNKRDNYKEKK